MVDNSSDLQRMRDWKESAMKVMPDFQEIAKLLDVPLGQSVSEQIIPAIKKMKEVTEIYKEAMLAGFERERKLKYDNKKLESRIRELYQLLAAR